VARRSYRQKHANSAASASAPGTGCSGRGPGRHGGKGAGWDHVHVCVDDATRLADVEVLDDEQAATVTGFLRRAVAFYRCHGTHRRLDAQSARSLHEQGNRVENLFGAGDNVAAALIAQAGDAAASKTPPPSRANAAPPRSPAAQDKPAAGSACTAALACRARTSADLARRRGWRTAGDAPILQPVRAGADQW
jgi:hypothetical protein